MTDEYLTYKYDRKSDVMHVFFTQRYKDANCGWYVNDEVADDIMEPYRPYVDELVIDIIRSEMQGVIFVPMLRIEAVQFLLGIGIAVADTVPIALGKHHPVQDGFDHLNAFRQFAYVSLAELERIH